MLRTLLLIFVPLTLLAAACSGGSTQPDVSKQPATDGADPSIVIDDGQADVSEQPATDGANPAIVFEADVDDGQPDSSAGDDAAFIRTNNSGGDLFSSFNPLELLATFGGGSLLFTSEIDPAIEPVLIRLEDLPAEFSSVADLVESVSSDVGEVEIAMRVFSTGDLESEDLDDTASMVMSAVLELPPEAADELASFDELAADFDQYQAEIAELGLGEMRLLDAADLGDGGVGLRLEIDFSGLFGPLLELGEEFAGEGTDFDAAVEDLLELGISIEMYLFPHSDRILVVMVMEPLGQPSGVDARSLAETMDERAARAF